MIGRISQRIAEKAKQVSDLLAHSHTPLPLILDSLRLQGRPFTAQMKDGTSFALEPKRGDWFTIYECCIRKDYLGHGIHLSPGDRVLDIGANFGAFAVTASRIVGPKGHVYAFEPSAESFARLSDNVARNGCSNVTIFNEAISDTDGELDFYVYDKSAYSSLYESVDTRAGGWARKDTVKCRSITSVLSDVGGDIALMKVDCEGGEYAIFSSTTATALDSVHQIAMEIHELPEQSVDDLKANIRTGGFVTQDTYPFVALRQGI